jgi:PPM family protein phosphatase
MANVSVFAATDIGLRRSKNEDSYALMPDRGLLAVADGMGGAAAGEVASRIFTDTTVEVFSGVPATEQEATLWVQDAFRRANERIRGHASGNPHCKDMGCTAEVLAFHAEGFVIGHVGDSRSYLFRRGQLRHLTRDHSLVQEQIEQGLLTIEQARSHSLRNVILRAVGASELLAVDLVRGKCLAGDIFLLCSDGLHDMVGDELIRDILALQEEVPVKAAKLIERARSAGGYDNITVVLAEILPLQEA